MSGRSVLWYEGMYLLPHHSQAAERLAQQELQRGHKWDAHYNWGLRTLDLDREALTNYRFVVRSLTARLRDGTLVAIPEDGNLEALDLKPALARASEVTVLLALPPLQLGKANVPPDDVPDELPAGGRSGDQLPTGEGNEKKGDTRFLVDVHDLEDENTGVNPQPVHVRLLNVKLLLGSEEHPGFELLPIARVMKPATAEAVPELDVTYIPPLLACDAWPPLAAGILESIYDRLGKKMESLARQVTGRNISFDSRQRGAMMRLTQLDVVNEGYALLNVLAFAEGVHPLRAYLELCRLVGQLAIFGESRRVPELPRYDHDDLGGCFYRIRLYLDQLLSAMPVDSYEERPFVGEELRMQVTLEPKWLEPKWQMFVGVRTPLSADECVRLLTRSGNLDMKIGSVLRVDEIFARGEAGLRFAHSPQPPEALPTEPDLVYFQINRESQQQEWQNVQKSLTLGIRLNQNRIAGNIQGQQTLTIRMGAQTTTMEFTLYLITSES
jgi:type VI secretion system protein ImpJ